MTRMAISHTQNLWYEKRHTHYHCKNVTGNVYAIFCVFMPQIPLTTCMLGGNIPTMQPRYGLLWYL